MRIAEHPVLGADSEPESVGVTIDGIPFRAKRGEVIAAVMLANGLRVHRHTVKRGEPRGVYCGIGQCTDCVMVVDGVANVRTCVTQVQEGMIIETQHGFGASGKQIGQDL